EGGIITIACRSIGAGGDLTRPPVGTGHASSPVGTGLAPVREEEACTDQMAPNTPPTGLRTGASPVPTEARPVPTEARPVPMEAHPVPMEWVELVVSDTGSGMAPDQLAQIFQPFYTTKAHGIGLGLPITRRLIEDHGGSLRVESQLGYGTTITIRLPVLSEEMIEGGEMR